MIQFYKLLNGEEIVAEADDEGGDWQESIEMHKPFRNVPLKNGQTALASYPCNLITVNTHHILFSGEPSEELANLYRKLTGGIITPPKGIQLSNPTMRKGLE